MTLATTSIQLSTTPTAILTTGTTAFNLVGGHIQDPVPIAIANMSTVLAVYIGGSSSITTASGAFPIGTTGVLSMSLHRSDPVWGLTSNSTAEIRVIVGRQ
jgi:hypothetical protein